MTESLSNKITSKNERLQINANLVLIVCISLVAISAVLGINPIMPNIAKSLKIPHQEIGLVMAL